MKYLLLGLLVIAGLAGRQPATPATASRFYAMAWYETTDAGLTTKVEISVHLHPTTSTVGLSIEQNRRSCLAGGCKDVPVISGYTLQEVDRADATIKPSLARAGLHTVIRFQDGITKTEIPIQVDVAWTGTGPTQCDESLGGPVCIRFATAIVQLRRGGQRLVTGVTRSDDILQRQPDRALTAPPLSGPGHVH